MEHAGLVTGDSAEQESTLEGGESSAGHSSTGVRRLPGAGFGAVRALQRGAGNAAVAQLLRDGPTTPAPPAPAAAPPAPQAIPRTSRLPIADEVRNLYSTIRLDEEGALRILLENQDRATELKTEYESHFHNPLTLDVSAYLGREGALRAADYLKWGRLQTISKVLLAIDGAGTATETLWRVLVDLHDEGAPNSKWVELVISDPDTKDLTICQRWHEQTTLDAALADDMSGNDLDKGRALVRSGKLEPIDKIRIATNRVGTDEDLLFEGLRECDLTNVRQQYQERYGQSLDDLLFDRYDDEGTLVNDGELSGRDEAEARAMLGGAGAPAGDPDRLVRLVRAATVGLGTDTDTIWREVGDAYRRAHPLPNSPPDAVAAAAVAQAQLDHLRAQVDDPNDPLDLRGWTGELNDDDHARLRALVGSTEGDPMLDDPQVKRLRALGGIEWDAFETLFKADVATTAGFAQAWADTSSQFHQYMQRYTTASSGQWGEMEVIFNGSLYARLALCAGGFRDDYEDYAYNLVENHATAAQKLELRRALRSVERGQPATNVEAGQAMAALVGAFSSSELTRVRNAIQAGQLDDPLERANELEENIERERSWWYGLDPALRDERREMRAQIDMAGRDAQLDPAEAMRLRDAERRTGGALQDYVRMRDEATAIASQAVSFAVGLLVTAITGGAAGPLVIGALMRAAVASAVANVLTEGALRGDRFDWTGGDAARAFVNGAVNGAMSVLGGRGATQLMESISGVALREAIEKGTAGFAVRTIHAGVEGGISGGVGGVVDATTNEDTYRTGVKGALGNIVNSAITSAGQGAAIGVGVSTATSGAKALGGTRPGAPGGDHPAPADPHAPPAPDPNAPRPASGPDPQTHPGQPDPSTPTTQTSAGVVVDPFAGMAVPQRDAACQALLQEFPRWEDAIAQLQRGTGAAQHMPVETRTALMAGLVEHRARLLEQVRTRFGGETVGNASSEPGSDADVNIRGDDAGAKLIAAREFLDNAHPNWEHQYRMALLIDPGRVGTVQEHLASLSPAERAQVQAQVDARVTAETERLAAARQLGQLQDPAQRTELLNRLPEADRARVQELAAMDRPQRLRAHDQALLDGDALMRRFRDTTDPAERLRLAEEITYKQMLANMLNDEAYISPGAVGEFVSQRPARTAGERYQAALDQILMISHQVQEAGGVMAAMRRYETFKYIRRFCDLLEASGLLRGDDATKLTWFQHWAEYIYRVEREATGSAIDTEGRRLAGSATTSAVRVDAEAGDVLPGVQASFLLDNYRDFRDFADRTGGQLRQAAHGGADPAAGAGTPPAPPTAPPPAAGGDAGPLLTLPPLTAADEAARTAPVAPAPTATTAAAGVGPAHGTTPVLNSSGRVNQPIGNPVAGEEAGQAIARRLTSGDATALTEIGVTPPRNYDSSGREWGVGRTANGDVVIIEGGIQGVTWADFLAAGGRPLGHTHPMLPGRELHNPGRTVSQLLPGTGTGDADAVHILPSVEDFMFCGENNLDLHDVHTPYVHEGNGRIGNPDPANPLPGVSFQIAGTRQVGTDPAGPVYRSLLIGHDANGAVFTMTEVYVVGNRHLNSILTAPPSTMTPLPPAGAGGAGTPPAGGGTPPAGGGTPPSTGGTP